MGRSSRPLPVPPRPSSLPPGVGTLGVCALPAEGRVLEWGRKQCYRRPFYVACWNPDEPQTAHFYRDYPTRFAAQEVFDARRGLTWR